MQTEKHFLTNIFSPKQFTPQDLETIISKFTRVTFAKNEYLLEEGRTAQYYWFIETGFIRSYVVDGEGNDITTSFFTAGDIAIDWPSFFMRTPTREYIQALTDCICWQLDHDTFQQLFHNIEPFREQGRARLVGSYFMLKKRSIAMIADPAKTRYMQLLSEKPEIIQNVSLKHIATFLGITDTSLSRIRKEVSQG